MGQGICNILQKLPEKSHFRKYLVSALSENVNDETLAEFLNQDSLLKSRLKYVQECRRIKPEENEILTTTYSQHTTRNSQVGQDSLETLTDFFLTHCKPINNPYGTILNSSVGKKQLFSSFKLLPNSSGIGYKCFLRVATELHVIKHKSNEFDLFHCPHCHESGWNIQPPPMSPNPSDEEVAKYLDYQKIKIHQLKVQIQWKLYHNTLNNLDESSLLIVQDIAKKFTQKKKCIVCVSYFFSSFLSNIFN